ncbi:MAG TPA: SdrD B-like domain-containing protein [Tepidisphaeraceae bacterium]
MERRLQFATSLPTSIAGYTFRCIIDDGAAPFASTGVFDFKPSKIGMKYTLDGIVGVPDSSGTYYYERSNRTTGRIIFDDRLIGPGTSLTLSLTANDKGEYELRDAAKTGFSEGTFTMSAPIATTGAINGYVFSDRNRNAVLDRRDTRLSGRSVWLDADADGVLDATERRTLTDATGYYSFTNVTPGTQRVRTNAPAGTVAVAPTSGYHVVRVRAGGNYTHRNIGFAAASTITGSIFRDANGNGRRSSGETGLSGWRIYIDANANGRFDRKEKSLFSDVAGNWTFKDMPASNVTLRINTTAFAYTAVLRAGRVLTGIDFGIPA